MVSHLAEKLIALAGEYDAKKVAGAWQKYSQNRHLSGLNPVLATAILKAGERKKAKESTKIFSREEKVKSVLAKNIKDQKFDFDKAEFIKDQDITGAVVRVGETMIDLSLATQINRLHKQLVK